MIYSQNMKNPLEDGTVFDPKFKTNCLYPKADALTKLHVIHFLSPPDQQRYVEFLMARIEAAGNNTLVGFDSEGDLIIQR